MKTQIAYGIFGTGHYPSLITPDKQLHVGPISTYSLEASWERIANTLAFLERECPSESFTLVLDSPRAFRNPFNATGNRAWHGAKGE